MTFLNANLTHQCIVSCAGRKTVTCAYLYPSHIDIRGPWIDNCHTWASHRRTTNRQPRERNPDDASTLIFTWRQAVHAVVTLDRPVFRALAVRGGISALVPLCVTESLRYGWWA